MLFKIYELKEIFEMKMRIKHIYFLQETNFRGGDVNILKAM